LVPTFATKEEHQAAFSRNKEDYLYKTKPVNTGDVEWYINKDAFLSDLTQENPPPLSHFELDGWRLSNLEILCSFADPPSQSVNDLAQLHRKYHHESNRAHSSPLMLDLFKQLSHCFSSVWKIQQSWSGGGISLSELHQTVAQTIIKLRHLVEQGLDRFAYNLIYWPNRIFPDDKDKSIVTVLNQVSQTRRIGELKSSKLIGNGLGKKNLDADFPALYDGISDLCELSYESVLTGEAKLWRLLVDLSNGLKHENFGKLYFHDENEYELIFELSRPNRDASRTQLLRRVEIKSFLDKSMIGLSKLIEIISRYL